MSVIEYTTSKDGKTKVTNLSIAGAQKRWLNWDKWTSIIFWAFMGACVGVAQHYIFAKSFTTKMMVFHIIWLIGWLITWLFFRKKTAKFKKDYMDEIDLETGLQVNADHGLCSGCGWR